MSRVFWHLACPGSAAERRDSTPRFGLFPLIQPRILGASRTGKGAMDQKLFEHTKAMLVALIDRKLSVRAVGLEFGIHHSLVDRRIKSLVRQAAEQHPIAHLDGREISSLLGLRQHAAAVKAAVEDFVPEGASGSGRDIDIAAGLERVRRLSPNPRRDEALLQVMLCSGAKPIEIASMRVRDCLAEDGRWRARIEIGHGRARLRPHTFDPAPALAALEAYLVHRIARRLGRGKNEQFRGLDPDSALFLSQRGAEFAIRKRAGRRAASTVLTMTFQAIFECAGWQGATTHTVRRHVARRLSEEHDDKRRVGELLGLSSRRSLARLLAERSRGRERPEAACA